MIPQEEQPPKVALFHIAVPTKRSDRGIQPAISLDGLSVEVVYAVNGESCVATIFDGTPSALERISNISRVSDEEQQSFRTAFATGLKDGTFQRLNGLKRGVE